MLMVHNYQGTMVCGDHGVHGGQILLALRFVSFRSSGFYSFRLPSRCITKKRWLSPVEDYLLSLLFRVFLSLD